MKKIQIIHKKWQNLYDCHPWLQTIRSVNKYSSCLFGMWF